MTKEIKKTPVYSLIKEFLKEISPPRARITQNKIALIEEIFLPLIHKRLTIDKDAEVFIPARVMQSYVREYQTIRDACFIMKGYHNRLKGKCDRIVGYTPKFEALYFSILKNLAAIQINQINNKSINRLSLLNKDFMPNIFPGVNYSFYTTSEKSARLYNGVQNLPRHIKSVLYEDMVDVDISNCHANIFYKELTINRLSVVSNDFMQMIDDPEGFLNRIIKDGVDSKIWLDYKSRSASNRSRAKFARSRLFYPPASGRKPRRTGIKWYDQLQTWILKVFKDNCIDNPHLWLTTKEQEIIQKAITVLGKDNIALLMHDGMILFGIDSFEDTLDLLERETGYLWTAKKLAV